MADDVIIDDSNFEQYFKDASKHRPEKGECLAIFKSMAELVNGDIKQEVILAVTTNEYGGQGAVQTLMKKCNMSYKEALRVCKEICQDCTTLSEQEVLDKPYKFLFEKQYYTHKDFVPKDNPHWQVVGLKNISIKDIEIKTEPVEQESA
jgi:hypothetical protein